MYASEIERFQQLINAADGGDHGHTADAAAAAAADVFTPATMARASLGLSLISVVKLPVGETLLITYVDIHPLATYYQLNGYKKIKKK